VNRPAILLLAVAACACPIPALADEPKEHGFEATVRNRGDRLTIAVERDTATLDVTSPRGIGSATIDRKERDWPKHVVVRLRLRGLESFRVTAGETTLAVEVQSHGNHARLLALWQGREEGPRLTTDSPYWTEVKMLDAEGNPATKIPLTGGYFEITLPRKLLEGNAQSLSLRWIDFLR